MEIAENFHAFLWDSMTINNCNTYLIDSTVRILIDPGHHRLFSHVEKGLNTLNLAPADIDLVICTHAHPDHMEAVQHLNPGTTPFTLHEKEWRFLQSVDKNIIASLGIDLESFHPEFLITGGRLSMENIDLQIIHTPGHSPGSVCIYWPDLKALVTGDLIFKEGVGRTDIPGGDGALLKKSIKRIIAQGIDIEWILPGHGPVVSGTDNIRNLFDQLETFWLNYI